MSFEKKAVEGSAITALTTLAGMMGGEVTGMARAEMAYRAAHPRAELLAALKKIEATIPVATDEVLKLEEVRERNLGGVKPSIGSFRLTI